MYIIKGIGACDPHVHIFNGKAYLFSTHDRGRGEKIFRMDDWRLFSSDDLVNWKLEFVLDPADTYLGPDEECYATDGAERNGKYYFYFSDQQRSTGVAVSENGPAGPYRDALGKPLLPQGLADTASYDPTVFIDDDPDRTPYILFGYSCIGKKYYIARLNDDMISLAETPRPIELINGWENDACWLMKHDGKYYLNSHGGVYAVSDNIYGPYTKRGRFCRDRTVDHGTFFSYNNQLYFTYGVPDDSDGPSDPFFRATKIIYAHFKDNGDIAIDEEIQEMGVGQYDAGIGEIKAEWYFAASDGIVKKENADGFELRGIKNGAYLYYPKVRNIPQNALITFRFPEVNDPQTCIEIREGSPFGHVIGCCRPEKGAAETSCRLSNAYGSADLCFVFRGGDGELLSFDGFSVR